MRWMPYNDLVVLETSAHDFIQHEKPRVSLVPPSKLGYSLSHQLRTKSELRPPNRLKSLWENDHGVSATKIGDRESLHFTAPTLNFLSFNLPIFDPNREFHRR
jgi:hypothetical protein